MIQHVLDFEYEVFDIKMWTDPLHLQFAVAITN